MIDNERAKKDGLEPYQQNLSEKMTILERLLADHNDGRRKNFYCIAINLLPLAEIKSIMANIESETSDKMTAKERAKLAVAYFQTAADQQKMTLKLRKKPKA